MPLPYGRLLHLRPAIINCKSCRMQHCELSQDAHKTQTYNICMAKHSYFPYTSTYSVTIQTENTTSITPLTLSLTTDATQQTPTDPHTVTTRDIKISMRHIHTFIVSRHLATRGNNQIPCILPPHINSSKEILPRLTRHTLAQLRTNKSPLLRSYIHKVDAKLHPSPLCPCIMYASVTLTYTTYFQLRPHMHCWPDGQRSWLVDHKREDWTPH